MEGGSGGGGGGGCGPEDDELAVDGHVGLHVAREAEVEELGGAVREDDYVGRLYVLPNARPHVSQARAPRPPGAAARRARTDPRCPPMCRQNVKESHGRFPCGGGPADDAR